MAAVYRAPPGGLYVVNPRTIFDIVARSLAIHCFAVCAYAQLTSLLSWTTHRRLTTVQITLFMLFPELAILQALFYVSLILITGRGRPDQFAHNHSADLAENNWKQRLRDNYGPDTSNIAKSTHRIVTETDGEKQFEDPSKRAFPWTLHLLFVITTCGPLIVTVLAYKQRLAIKYMAADYVGNLGLDHRNAWVSIGGIVAASGSIALLFLKRTSMSEVPFLKASIPNLELESLAPDIMLYQAAIYVTWEMDRF
ncbi:hypothetical protein MMC18_003109 [Xylographa bjoerkii]|nr:hypothetical protein [Xylographa bjoerkii]